MQKVAIIASVVLRTVTPCLRNARQVAERDGLAPEEPVQQVRLPRRGAVEVVDPDAGIHEDHQSVLMRSRSPVRFSLPR